MLSGCEWKNLNSNNVHLLNNIINLLIYNILFIFSKRKGLLRFLIHILHTDIKLLNKRNKLLSSIDSLFAILEGPLLIIQVELKSNKESNILLKRVLLVLNIISFFPSHH